MTNCNLCDLDNGDDLPWLRKWPWCARWQLRMVTTLRWPWCDDPDSWPWCDDRDLDYGRDVHPSTIPFLCSVWGGIGAWLRLNHVCVAPPLSESWQFQSFVQRIKGCLNLPSTPKAKARVLVYVCNKLNNNVNWKEKQTDQAKAEAAERQAGIMPINSAMKTLLCMLQRSTVLR